MRWTRRRRRSSESKQPCGLDPTVLPGRAIRPASRKGGDRPLSDAADPPDLPFEPDPARLEDPAADLFAQLLDVGRASMAAVDEKIAMHGRDLRVANDQAATARGVDQLPGLP